MAKAKTPTITNHRDAKTGQFVTPEYVKRHPGTTTTERNPLPKPSAPRKKP
ncbi:hypothetical protein [Noviherbaspirillum sp.]|uniref:hypothetical protein n=1 Tax=Noviherbaspirillum sp. TaxID=1926288 RepID=UPI002FE4083A